MKKLLLLLTLAISAFAQSTDTPPTIPAETQRAFEQARADEMETAKVHDADLVRLKAAFAAAQAYCKDGYEVQRPQRDGPLACVAKTIPQNK